MRWSAASNFPGLFCPIFWRNSALHLAPCFAHHIIFFLVIIFFYLEERITERWGKMIVCDMNYRNAMRDEKLDWSMYSHPDFCPMKSGWCSWLALFTRQRVAQTAMWRRVARPSPMSRLLPLFWIRLGAINKWFVFPIYGAHPFTLFLTIPTDHHRYLKLEPATGSSGSHTAEANGGCETFMWCVVFVISDLVSSILLWLVELYRAWLLASDPLLDRRDNNHT